MRLRLIMLGLAVAATGMAQSIDYSQFVTSQLDDLVTTGSPLLVNTGLTIVNGFAGTVFILLMIRLAFLQFSHSHLHINVWPILSFMFMVAGIDTMLHFYAQPIPGVGYGLSRLPAEIFLEIAAYIDVSRYTLLNATALKWFGNVQQPGNVLALMDNLIYAFGWINIAFLEAILFIVTIFGYVFYGLTALVGPVFVAALLFPMFRQYFHSWLSTLIRFGFYTVPAAAFVYIWAGAWIKFFNDVAGTDYTLPHLLKMIVPMVMLNLAMFVTALRIPNWVDNVFSGSSSAAGGGLVPGVISKFF